MILNLIGFFIGFILVRLSFIIKVQVILYKEALSDVEKEQDVSWFIKSGVYTEIFNPIHWNKWTAKQWIKYYKGTK